MSGVVNGTQEPSPLTGDIPENSRSEKPDFVTSQVQDVVVLSAPSRSILIVEDERVVAVDRARQNAIRPPTIQGKS